MLPKIIKIRNTNILTVSLKLISYINKGVFGRTHKVFFFSIANIPSLKNLAYLTLHLSILVRTYFMQLPFSCITLY
jgi:hypothetical protein